MGNTKPTKTKNAVMKPKMTKRQKPKYSSRFVMTSDEAVIIGKPVFK